MGIFYIGILIHRYLKIHVYIINNLNGYLLEGLFDENFNWKPLWLPLI